MTDRLAADPEGIGAAARLLADGALVAFPTDTVHGVACRADDPEALERLIALKGRPPQQRIACLVADLVQAAVLGLTADAAAHKLADALWPGGLTLVLPAPFRTDDATTMGVRAPDHPTAQALLAITGPLQVTSANPHGFPETYTADDVLIAFAGAADLAAVIEGDSPGGVASSVLDLTGERPKLLREGAISRDRIEAVVGPID
jgi:L-threonylcarbamoyladenylate synthase